MLYGNCCGGGSRSCRHEGCGDYGFGVYFQFNVGFGCCVCSIVMFEVFEMEFVALCRVRSTFGGLLCFCIFVS